MTAKAAMGGAVSKLSLWVTILLGVASWTYAQNVSDVIKVADSVTSASADDPLLAVIKILAVVDIVSLAFNYVLVRSLVKATESTTSMAAKPCVLAHANPQLFAKILEGANRHE
jgi:hypothetical protein